MRDGQGLLRDLLDRAADSGRSIRLWWRDDDAVAATPALDRLLRLSADSGLRLALAAIPDAVEPSLPERLADARDVAVLVHGLSHADHAPGGEKRAEFGPHRPLAALARDAGRGLALASETFGRRALPVFVPPWNRFDPRLAKKLPGLGYEAVSAFGTPGLDTRGGLRRLDTHLDPVDWRGSRSLLPMAALAVQLRAALLPEKPVIGLLTHHLVLDDALWRFCEAFLALAAGHPAVRPCAVDELIDRRRRIPAALDIGPGALPFPPCGRRWPRAPRSDEGCSSTATAHPSSVTASPCHLLPQGEKGRGSRAMAGAGR